ncbi:terpene synthase family protein [Kitasatospora sp. NPDC048540]|uniref:terpene synthase family protein n=1 Tax=Kitasatospora sp. NPDC048540 TaxID=3155634 RepID=UPI0011EA6E60
MEPNPLTSRAEAAMWSWIDETGLCPTPADRRRVADADVPLLISLLYPSADADTLSMLGCYYAFIFVNDDLFDENISNTGPQRCYEELRHVIGVLDGEPAENPVAKALADVWRWACERQGPSWQESFRTHTRDAIWCYYTSAVNRHSRRLPHLEQYLEFRRDDIGGLPFLDMCEPATGTDLPGMVRRLSSHTELTHAAADWIGLCNDFHSLRKEREGGYHSDVFAVLQTHEGLSLPDAVVRADALMTRCIERMQSASEQLLAQVETLALPAEVQADTEACVRAYQDTVVGFLLYHPQAPRFADPEPAGTHGRAVSDLFRPPAGPAPSTTTRPADDSPS